MNGEFYVRKKSRLTGKRFRNDEAFEGSRRSAARFKRGNELASEVYGSLPQEQKFYKLFCRLKREAILWLKQGKTEEEVVRDLEMICANPETPTCHLNLSLPATARPVLYRDWYKQKEKVYEYNYDSHKSPKRKQRIVYFEGSEHLPLNLSTKDIVDITEGTETDMLNVIKKMEERLKRKQRATMKKAAAVQQEKQVETQEKPTPSTVHTPKYLLPKFTRSIVALPRAESEACNPNFRIGSRRKVSRQALFRKKGCQLIKQPSTWPLASCHM